MDLGNLGFAAAIGLAAIGSALGAGIAGQSAIGAWKKCFANNKPAPFMLVAFVGAPLTQTIYGFILMNSIIASSQPSLFRMSAGIFAGIAMGFSAYMQGKAGAAASDALAETGKGFGNYLMVLGLVETVALFVMVFVMGVV
ncbi:MAG: V-type ATP synthase subunit K [Spirochaetaceae bacterium]|jgi:V/A-type H+-transporting ATPase subunit K|nr:V-type ATP synthase subunit K [Spirochaetaceae bacterium]